MRARQNSLEEQRKSSHSQNSSHSAANQGMDSLRQNSKVTIPKPFRMMLREEDRKRRNVKTRSEMELENERLKKELDELKECSKKFRAKPAPASTYLLFYDIINKHPNKLQRQKNQINQTDHHGNHHKQGTQHQSPTLPQQPFSFIERERKKREKKLADELNNLTPKAERRVFKARPVPRSLYRPSSPTCQIYEAVNLNHRGSALPPSILDDTLQEGEEAENEYEYEYEFSRPQSTDISRCSNNLRKWRNKAALQVEEEMERKRNRERDRDWSYFHPLRRTSLCHSQEPLNTCKSDYISV
ncbi:protein FAM161A-like isoform X1 [Onychostoma macrolepis]|uniref:protein FAM161A-like isoform X1 n=1 Tax=Onychostoma macrolepis TaxID=369639 RepID=UPI00272D7B25|nr:protein FAM161A-like isoform X1 [Onychostoma macrolepis]